MGAALTPGKPGAAAMANPTGRLELLTMSRFTVSPVWTSSCPPGSSRTPAVLPNPTNGTTSPSIIVRSPFATYNEALTTNAEALEADPRTAEPPAPATTKVANPYFNTVRREVP